MVNSQKVPISYPRRANVLVVLLNSQPRIMLMETVCCTAASEGVHSEGGFRTGGRNVSHRQQSLSGL